MTMKTWGLAALAAGLLVAGGAVTAQAQERIYHGGGTDLSTV